MKYYRIIFRTGDDGVPEWTDIIEQEMDDESFQSINWEKPIIRQVIGDQTHFLSLDSNYLEVMILGIKTFRDHTTISQSDTLMISK